ncbi:MAG: hypothetical protein M1820_004807 [Bogoriella megaspora]|nr:MAG: hypothetical protein M1820_004807 [Bogoriella megaspora]
MFLIQALLLLLHTTFIASASLKSVLSSHPSLSILNSLLQQFDLLDSFDSYQNITLIAPTDDAYRALAQWGFNVSLVEPFIARALLRYHVLDGTFPTLAVPETDPKVVQTFLQPPVLTNVTRGAGVKILRTSPGSGSRIVTESGLQVIGGVEEADIAFDEGIIHTLNSSMVLPHNISTTAAVANLTEFLQLMDDADMVSILEELKDATLFVPWNGALEKARPLLRFLEPEQLASVLKYHAIPNKVLYGEALAKGGKISVKSLQGATLQINADSAGELYVNNAKVVRRDLMIYGGVAHIVEDILVPEAKETASDSFSAPELPIYDTSSKLRFQMPKSPWTPPLLW